MPSEEETPEIDLSGLSLDELKERLQALTARGDGILRSTNFLRHVPLAYQWQWHNASEEIRPVIAPNQQGKSVWGSIETLIDCSGVRPIAMGGSDITRWPRGIRKGYRAFVGGESFDALRDNVVPKFNEFIPPGMLLGQPKKNAEGFPYLYRFVSGAEMLLFSYQQEVSVFEGAVWDRAWFDEPPPQAIFNAVRRGLMARQGRTDLSLTPLKEAWLLDELLIPSQDPENPLYGAVAKFDAIDIHANCIECNPGVGTLPHARILTFLALVPKSERMAREFGIFSAVADLEFDYVDEQTHVVADVDPTRFGWPIVEIVDPAMKRPLHIGWFTVDPDENWYWFHAAQVQNDGFRRMVTDIMAHRRFVKRQPDAAIMDRRGGQHRIDVDLKQDWFEKFRQAGIVYEKSVDTHVQTLHDWLRPQFNPVNDKAIPKLRICRAVAEMEKGPLWAFRRFVWSPSDSPRKQYEQKGKDWVDLAMYLRASELSYKRLSARSEQEGDGKQPLALSYSRRPSDGGDRRGRRTSLAESYNRSDWTKLIPRGYS